MDIIKPLERTEKLFKTQKKLIVQNIASRTSSIRDKGILIETLFAGTSSVEEVPDFNLCVLDCFGKRRAFDYSILKERKMENGRNVDCFQRRRKADRDKRERGRTP